MKKPSWLDGSDGCTTMKMYLIPMNWTLKNGSDDKFYAMLHHIPLFWQASLSAYKC
jgi:hypothetical protein